MKTNRCGFCRGGLFLLLLFYGFNAPALAALFSKFQFVLK